jgi:dihydroorotate dehydrogenase
MKLNNHFTHAQQAGSLSGAGAIFVALAYVTDYFEVCMTIGIALIGFGGIVLLTSRKKS